MFKKIIVGMMVVCSVFTVAGCGTQETQEQEQTVNVQESYVPTTWLDVVDMVFDKWGVRLTKETVVFGTPAYHDGDGIYRSKENNAIMVISTVNESSADTERKAYIMTELVDYIGGTGAFSEAFDYFCSKENNYADYKIEFDNGELLIVKGTRGFVFVINGNF